YTTLFRSPGSVFNERHPKIQLLEFIKSDFGFERMDSRRGIRSTSFNIRLGCCRTIFEFIDLILYHFIIDPFEQMARRTDYMICLDERFSFSQYTQHFHQFPLSLNQWQIEHLP